MDRSVSLPWCAGEPQQGGYSELEELDPPIIPQSELEELEECRSLLEDIVEFQKQVIAMGQADLDA